MEEDTKPQDAVQKENAEPKKEERKRSVFVSGKAAVRTYDDAGNVVREEMVNRNVHDLMDALRRYEPSAIVGLYLVEDEEKSEPPAEGEERYSMPLLPSVKDKDGNVHSSERLQVVDALSRLAEIVSPDKIVLAQFHEMCDRASATSKFECGIFTFVMDGKAAGFAFVNSCRDVPVTSLALLYETSKSQVASLKDNLRKIAPSIQFSDDPEAKNPIVVPGGAATDREIVSPDDPMAGPGNGFVPVVEIR